MRSLDRLIGVLEIVAENAGPIAATTVADKAGLSLSTTSRLMRLLTEQGLLERDQSAGRYRLGLRLWAVARGAGDRGRLPEVAIPVMEGLRDVTGETVSLHIRSGSSRVCIAEVQSTRPVRRVVPVGLSLPLHLGATGEVLLAGINTAERRRYLQQLEQPSTAAVELESRLSQINQAGWAMAVDTWEAGLSGIAGAVIHDGQTVASLSASGPSYRWSVTAMREHVGDVLQAADRISRLV